MRDLMNNEYCSNSMGNNLPGGLEKCDRRVKIYPVNTSIQLTGDIGIYQFDIFVIVFPALAFPCLLFLQPA